MLTYNLTNYGWNNGVLMIAVFALVCLILIGILINFMTSGGNKKEPEE
ncbi:MAG: hypothetical protein HRU50_12460 [Winogradskyella sp.]|nr:hypothetical protein [Winogradskyella sp.]NRB60736.1 hypothetical protein [Winogradskyella sp.]